MIQQQQNSSLIPPKKAFNRSNTSIVLGQVRFVLAFFSSASTIKDNCDQVVAQWHN